MDDLILLDPTTQDRASLKVHVRQMRDCGLMDARSLARQRKRLASLEKLLMQQPTERLLGLWDKQSERVADTLGCVAQFAASYRVAKDHLDLLDEMRLRLAIALKDGRDDVAATTLLVNV